MGISSLQGMLSADVKVEPFKSQGRHAKTYGVSETYRAHIERGHFELEDPNGQSVVGKFKIIFGSAVQVDIRDRITIPKEYGIRDSSGDFQTVQPNIYSVEHKFFRGVHDHTVVICG
ncbi:MAG TPA: hypothetical protein VLB09_05650 [Nitrospiria bacterium]|nr:hypothetical protein [Nitrospiria bacterium]